MPVSQSLHRRRAACGFSMVSPRPRSRRAETCCNKMPTKQRLLLILLIACFGSARPPAGHADDANRTARPSGIADIDLIRSKVASDPTSASSVQSRRAARDRWWRLLWHQGYDMNMSGPPPGIRFSAPRGSRASGLWTRLTLPWKTSAPTVGSLTRSTGNPLLQRGAQGRIGPDTMA